MEYKRILIINDDNREDEFFLKYSNLANYRHIIDYCNDRERAFDILTNRDFWGFDKIILDIKIDWSLDGYYELISEYVALDKIKGINNGFILFMYLLISGYPINRIAFLSAYIAEKDEEIEKKRNLLKEMEQLKLRNVQTDKKLMQKFDAIPSLKDRFNNEIKRYSKEKESRDLRPYKNIIAILRDNIGTSGDKDPKLLQEIQSNNDFFERLTLTGIKGVEKIRKSDKRKLQEWIEYEKTADMKAFYEFRNLILNICECAKKIDPSKLYSLYNNKDFKKNYPEQYFKDLFSKIQYEMITFREDHSVDQVLEQIVNDLVAFWESLDKKYILHIDNNDEKNDSFQNEVNEHALTMVLKNTRNWLAHGRINVNSVDFCRLIFIISIEVIYGLNTEMEEYLYNFIKDDNISHDNSRYLKIFEDINTKIMSVKDLKTNTYTFNLSDLYYKYSLDRARNSIELCTKNLIEMFILCLHYPKIVKKKDTEEMFAVEFYEIDYMNQSKLMKVLEKEAVRIIDNKYVGE